MNTAIRFISLATLAATLSLTAQAEDCANASTGRTVATTTAAAAAESKGGTLAGIAANGLRSMKQKPCKVRGASEEDALATPAPAPPTKTTTTDGVHLWD